MRRVLLDEGVLRPLAKLMRHHGIDAAAFPNDWKQLSNGALLDRVEQEGFMILITCDKNMDWQQSLAGRDLAVLALPTNRWLDAREMLPFLKAALSRLRSQEFAELTRSGHLMFRPL